MGATKAYQEEAVRSADAVQLVILLHEMLIEDLRRCVTAARVNDIVERTSNAGHALMVLDQLQRGVDLQRGGEAANNMDRLYALARVEVVRAQLHADASMFEKQMQMFISLRDAWQQVRTWSKDAPSEQDVPALDWADGAQGRDWTV